MSVERKNLTDSLGSNETREGPFRIQAVAAMTGVAETTLRAWERRYGVPTPERTASGYRLYGAREVAQVQEMLRLCEERGLAPAEAARAIHKDGATLFASPMGPVAVASNDAAWESAVAAILSAVEAFDEVELDDAMRRLPMMGHSSLIIDKVIQPALRVVGERWIDGTLTIAHEHLLAHRVNTFLRGMLQLTANTREGARVVLGCFPDESHDLGLLATALRLASWGLCPLFLGARTPPAAIHGAVEATSLALVFLSVSIAPPRVKARELIDEYAAACGMIPWIVGGAGASSIRDLIEARGGMVAPEDGPALRRLVSANIGGESKRRTQ
jgi:MerR family transcriptional regulator, light-induced transcriptional regulator